MYPIIVVFYRTHFKDHLEILTWHQHLGISNGTGKINFSNTNYFWKTKHDQFNSCIDLFGASITLVKLLISLWSFFINLEASIGVVEKSFFGFLEYSSISISKKELQWNATLFRGVYVRFIHAKGSILKIF